MGWSGGASLMREIINAFQEEVKDEEQRYKVYLKIIRDFEQCDWDNQADVMTIDPAYDRALKELHPDWDL